MLKIYLYYEQYHFTIVDILSLIIIKKFHNVSLNGILKLFPTWDKLVERLQVQSDINISNDD